MSLAQEYKFRSQKFKLGTVIYYFLFASLSSFKISQKPSQHFLVGMSLTF